MLSGGIPPLDRLLLCVQREMGLLANVLSMQHVARYRKIIFFIYFFRYGVAVVLVATGDKTEES